MNFKRRIGGRIAKASGAQFENIIKAQCHFHKIACIQIPSGMRVIKGAQGKIIPVPTQTPFDFVLGFEGKALFIDAKSTEKNTFSFSQLVDHQMHFLNEMKRSGNMAGYLICFNRTDIPKAAYFDIDQLRNIKQRESVCLEDGVQVGALYEIDLRKIFGTINESKGIENVKAG